MTEAPNGRLAVQAAQQDLELDLIILDIMMPELSGIEASKEIRRISSAPILFLTARTQEQDKLEAYQSGGDDYLAKPFSHGELLMKVDSLIRRYRVYKGKVTGKQLKSDVVLDEENRRVLVNGQPLELTETEFSILQCLAQKRRVGRADLRGRMARKIYAGVQQHRDGTYREPAQEARGRPGKSPPDPDHLGEGVSD